MSREIFDKVMAEKRRLDGEGAPLAGRVIIMGEEERESLEYYIYRYRDGVGYRRAATPLLPFDMTHTMAIVDERYVARVRTNC